MTDNIIIMNTSPSSPDNNVMMRRDFSTDTAERVLVTNGDCSMAIYKVAEDGGIQHHISYSIAPENSFLNIVTSEKSRKALELLLLAVNNRTIERNYFKRYAEMLEEVITEDEFAKELETNPNDYIVEQNQEPDLERVKLALELSEKIKDVDTMDDLSSLFSFCPLALESIITEEHGEIDK